MTIFLVRHGQAQSREAWPGDDHGRPLTKRGRRQAERLLAAIGDRPIGRVLSSPAQRCVDTVAPLAAKAGVEIDITTDLAEGADPAQVLALAVASDTDTVLGVHGDVIPEILRLVATTDGTEFGDELRWAKGSAWALERDGDRVTRAWYVHPSDH